MGALQRNESMHCNEMGALHSNKMRALHCNKMGARTASNSLMWVHVSDPPSALSCNCNIYTFAHCTRRTHAVHSSSVLACIILVSLWVAAHSFQKPEAACSEPSEIPEAAPFRSRPETPPDPLDRPFRSATLSDVLHPGSSTECGMGWTKWPITLASSLTRHTMRIPKTRDGTLPQVLAHMLTGRDGGEVGGGCTECWRILLCVAGATHVLNPVK